jgi:hypothetical protein
MFSFLKHLKKFSFFILAHKYFGPPTSFLVVILVPDATFDVDAVPDSDPAVQSFCLFTQVEVRKHPGILSLRLAIRSVFI